MSATYQVADNNLGQGKTARKRRKKTMATLHSRSLAEHLNTFASLLEAEAIRANSLGLKGSKDLAREAMDVRRMANQLWEADTLIALQRPERIVAEQLAVNGLPVAHPSGLQIWS